MRYITTIKEIARLAELSSTTVSRILNQDPTLKVPEETRERVLTIVSKLQYKSRKKRRTQATDTSQKIGVVTFLSEQAELSDPYFLSIRSGIDRRCADLGIEPSSFVRWSNQGELSVNFSELDGIIVIGDHPTFADTVGGLCEHVVFIDVSPDPSRYDSVVIDFHDATKSVLDYLLGLGHQRIGYIGGTRSSGKDGRQSAFEEILGSEGYFNRKYVFIGDWSANSGYRLMMEAIAMGNLPTAFFIGSDQLTFGALHALREAGLAVPDDVSMVGFDDIETARFMQPPLTTVRVFPEVMGRAAVDLLADRIRGRELPYKLVVPTKLIVRQSCSDRLSMHVGG